MGNQLNWTAIPIQKVNSNLASPSRRYLFSCHDLLPFRFILRLWDFSWQFSLDKQVNETTIYMCFVFRNPYFFRSIQTMKICLIIIVGLLWEFWWYSNSDKKVWRIPDLSFFLLWHCVVCLISLGFIKLLYWFRGHKPKASILHMMLLPTYFQLKVSFWRRMEYFDSFGC